MRRPAMWAIVAITLLACVLALALLIGAVTPGLL